MDFFCSRRARRGISLRCKEILAGAVTRLARRVARSLGRRECGICVEDTSAYSNADGPTFRMTKTDGTVYDMLLDGPASLCYCRGFERFGMSVQGGKGCKHIAALNKLQQLGKL